MSFISDVFDFEKFNLKDMWRKAKNNPEQLLLGAADPFGAKIWGGLLGKDYEPIVNQMGGAYGGGSLGMDKTGGVYKSAKEAGIKTGPGATMHNLAESIAGTVAGGYGAGKLPMPNSLQPINQWQIPRRLPNPGGTSQSQASSAPLWLQKMHSGFGRMMNMGAPSNPYLTQDEQKASQHAQRMAMASVLLQNSGPRPKGTSNPIGDIGSAMQAGQQAGQQFTADAMRARIAAAQLAQATNPQERAEPAQVRIARILADPNTPEQVKQEIRAQMGPNMDPNDLLRSELLRLEILRERRDADTAATQKARDSDARAYAITSGLEQIDKIADLTRSLEGTLMEPGPFADTRRVALGTFGKVKELAGMESNLPEQAAQMDMLVKGVNDQLIGLMDTQALGQGTNAKLAAYQRSLANENISPAAIMSIQAQLAKDLLAQAKSEGIDIPNRSQIEARIKEMESHTSVTRPMIDAPAAIATATDIANMGVEQLQALDVSKLSDEELRAARDRWDKLNAQ